MKKKEKKSNKKKELILTVVALVSLVVITLGTTYAFFHYAKEGTTENAITTGTITFLYTEIDKIGKGISISDAFPMSDELGKSQMGDDKVFNFKITSTTTSKNSIPYEITARKNSKSTLDESAVKMYLTKVNGTEEQQVLLKNYNELPQTKKVSDEKHIEKTLYQDRVPANQEGYEQAYRLRMWIDEDTDFSQKDDESYSYNDKTFTVTVNVYAEGKVVASKESIIKEDSILSILNDNEFEEGNYQFEVQEEKYLVHMYVYNGNQHWTTTDKTIFGDAQDVATKTENAKNMVIVKVNGNLEIDSGVTVGPYYDSNYGGPKGFLLYVEGTLTNNGTIDNSHGAKAEGQNVYLWKNSNGTYETVPAVGATGAAAVSITGSSSASQNTANGNPGSNGQGRQTGGGGSGGAACNNCTGVSGSGSMGTSYSGGTGGGSVDRINQNDNATGGQTFGGAGGSSTAYQNSCSYNKSAGGGAGNPGGDGAISCSGSAENGKNGTGGLLVIYANILNNYGTISANGANGGAGRSSFEDAKAWGTSGGSSGGGSINIFYRTSLISGIVNANGGTSPRANGTGGSGGNGSITYTQVIN